MEIIILSSIILILILIIGIGTYTRNKDKERYKDSLGWDSNSCSHCMQTGKELVAGTVFASNPENDPGLGWIL